MIGAQGLLLAAGAGRRFGGRKLLADWRGEPLVRAAARRALASPVERVWAVTGCDADEVAAALAGLGPRLALVHEPAWEEGLAASLRAGVAALPEGATAAVVWLADMPLVPSAAPLLDAVAAGAVAAEYVAAAGPGHPVALGPALLAEVAALTGDAGARRLLQGRAGVERIATDDPGATYDVDRPSDLGAAVGTGRGPAGT